MNPPQPDLTAHLGNLSGQTISLGHIALRFFGKKDNPDRTRLRETLTGFCPPGHLLLGTDANGDLITIDHTATGPVVLVRHKSPAATPQPLAPGLAHFIAICRAIRDHAKYLSEDAPDDPMARVAYYEAMVKVMRVIARTNGDVIPDYWRPWA